jgi:translation machinery-associated protein 16
LIQNTWLARHDEELQAEQQARRKGRPKSVHETKLEEMKLRESEEYRTGLGTLFSLALSSLLAQAADRSIPEVIDLTHPATVALFRNWDQKEVAYLQLLRYIRISSTDPTSFVVSKPGKHALITEDQKNESALSADMDVDGQDNVLSSMLTAPGISSTMMAMDNSVI